MDIRLLKFPDCETVYRDFNRYQYRMLAQHSWPWQKVLATFGGWEWHALGVFDESGHLVGCIPFCETSADGVRVIMSSPLPASYAGVLHVEDCDRTKIYKILLESLCDYAGDHGVDLVTILTSPFRDDAELYTKHLQPTYTLKKFYQYLPGGSDPKKFSNSKFRNNLKRSLRRADAHGLAIGYPASVTRDHLSRWYSDVLETRFREIAATPPPREFIAGVIEELGPEGLGEFACIEHEGKIVAAGLSLYGWVQDIYLRASLCRYMKMGAGMLLDYRTLERGYHRNVNGHNFQSSPTRDSAVFAYKQQWGCLEDFTYYFVKVVSDSRKFTRMGKEEACRLFPHFFILPYHVYK